MVQYGRQPFEDTGPKGRCVGQLRVAPKDRARLRPDRWPTEKKLTASPHTLPQATAEHSALAFPIHFFKGCSDAAILRMAIKFCFHRLASNRDAHNA